MTRNKFEYLHTNNFKPTFDQIIMKGQGTAATDISGHESTTITLTQDQFKQLISANQPPSHAVHLEVKNIEKLAKGKKCEYLS